jgi:hypothetical protein
VTGKSPGVAGRSSQLGELPLDLAPLLTIRHKPEPEADDASGEAEADLIMQEDSHFPLPWLDMCWPGQQAARLSRSHPVELHEKRSRPFVVRGDANKDHHPPVAASVDVCTTHPLYIAKDRVVGCSRSPVPRLDRCTRKYVGQAVRNGTGPVFMSALIELPKKQQHECTVLARWGEAAIRAPITLGRIGSLFIAFARARQLFG